MAEVNTESQVKKKRSLSYRQITLKLVGDWQPATKSIFSFPMILRNIISFLMNKISFIK